MAIKYRNSMDDWKLIYNDISAYIFKYFKKRIY